MLPNIVRHSFGFLRSGGAMFTSSFGGLVRLKSIIPQDASAECDLQVLPVSTHDGALRSIVPASLETLRKSGIRTRVVMNVHPNSTIPTAFLVCTGGTEHAVMKHVSSGDLLHRRNPLLLLTHSHMNSLPAAAEVLAKIRQMKHVGRIFHLGEDESGCTQLRSALRTLEVSRKMERERIGVIGIPSDWLVASVPSSKVVKDVWGSTLVRVPLEELFHEMRYISSADVLSSARTFFRGAHASTVQEMSVVDAMKVHTGLRRIIDRYRLTSLTVRCFDIVEKLHTTGCVALSQLTDEGIVAGCEGDVPALLTMLLLYHMSDQRVPFMANPQSINIAQNTVDLAHCTIPRGMLSQYDLRSHFETREGVGIQGDVHLGHATMARIGGDMLDHVFFSGAEVRGNGKDEQRCRTQITLQMEKDVSYFLQRPLGNHHVIVHGDWSSQIADFVSMFNRVEAF
eukprot:TRINITY_DN80608_c0_g1_i1.p1 TRINITY_DN80608_c0_g1~~TRINITY_DN80608_c0_g1_i1.p1  ORF type:complete len:454 (-),score=135.92 TRINITY_DN80608_c0_g1_i1:131-1492(-)